MGPQAFKNMPGTHHSSLRHSVCFKKRTQGSGFGLFKSCITSGAKTLPLGASEHLCISLLTFSCVSRSIDVPSFSAITFCFSTCCYVSTLLCSATCFQLSLPAPFLHLTQIAIFPCSTLPSCGSWPLMESKHTWIFFLRPTLV